jgi:hypothetical protein
MEIYLTAEETLKLAEPEASVFGYVSGMMHKIHQLEAISGGPIT